MRVGVEVGGAQGRGYSDIFIHTKARGFKILNFDILGVFRKMNIFGV